MRSSTGSNAETSKRHRISFGNKFDQKKFDVIKVDEIKFDENPNSMKRNSGFDEIKFDEN